jgi:hypothetical protein
MTIPRYSLFISIPAVLIGLWLLIRMIGNLVRAVRQSTVLAVSMSPSQEIRFTESGQLHLYLEARRGANLSGLDFHLQDEAGRPVALDSMVLRTTVSGVSRVRLKVRHLELPHAGVFTLDISGLRPGMDPENRVVFGRPIGRIILGHILGFVVLGILIVGGLLASIWSLLPRR